MGAADDGQHRRQGGLERGLAGGEVFEQSRDRGAFGQVEREQRRRRETGHPGTQADADAHHRHNRRMAESLRGKLILASPVLRDPNFVRSVVLIAAHTEEGAMGLVLNRPAAATVGEAVPDLSWLAGDEEPVYVGGPVAETAVIVLAEFDRPELA